MENFGKNQYTFYVSLIVLILHLGLCYLFMVKMGMGIQGLALASVIRELCGFLLLLFFTNRQEDIQEAVFMPDGRSFTELGE